MPYSGDYLKGYFYGYFLVKVKCSGIFTYFLHRILDHDKFTVNLESGFLKRLRNLDRVYAAENSAGRAGLCTDSKFYFGERCCESLCVGLDLGKFVGTLTLVFGKLLQSRR